MKKILLFATAIATLLAGIPLAACGADDGAYEPAFITGDEIGSDDESDGEAVYDADADGGTDNVTDNSKNLVIPLDELTTNAKFYGINVDGTYMEVMAFRSGFTYRTAFNTCQICYGSRKAYYLQSGNYLVCQNCRSKFSLSAVGVSTNAYTCSPYPILDTDRTEDNENIVISYEFLVKSKNLFRTWRFS